MIGTIIDKNNWIERKPVALIRFKWHLQKETSYACYTFKEGEGYHKVCLAEWKWI